MKKSPDVKPQNILERTFDFAVRIVKLSGKLDERPGVGRIMMSQILRAGTSVRETHLRLRLLATAKIVDEVELQSMINEAEEIKRVIGAIIVSSRRNTTSEHF